MGTGKDVHARKFINLFLLRWCRVPEITRIHGSVTRPDESAVTKGKYVLRIRKQLLVHPWNGPIRIQGESMT